TPAYQGNAKRLWNMAAFAARLLRRRATRKLARPDIIVGSTLTLFAAHHAGCGDPCASDDRESGYFPPCSARAPWPAVYALQVSHDDECYRRYRGIAARRT